MVISKSVSMGLVLLLVLGVSGHAWAKQPNPIQCRADGNQAELNACAGLAFDKADKALNKTWAAIQKRYASEPVFRHKLREAERLWIRFRDASLAARYPVKQGKNPEYQYGTVYPMCIASYKSDLTQQRTQQLQFWLADAPARNEDAETTGHKTEPGSAEQRTYPVWMDNVFTLGTSHKSFSPIDQAAWQQYFNQPFLNPDDKPYAFTLYDAKHRHMKADNCRAVFKADRGGYESGYPNGPVYYAWATECYAGVIISRMTDSDRSFVAHFKLNPKNVGKLPVMLRPFLSSSQYGRLKADQHKGLVLGDLLKGAKIKATSVPGKVTIDYPDGFSQQLRVLAKGDYNQDGIQDMLVESQSSTMGGAHPLFFHYLYLLTRDSGDGTFRILLSDSDPHTTQGALQQLAEAKPGRAVASAQNHLRQTDAALNRVWDAIHAHYADSPFFLHKLRDAQRLWIKLRDAGTAAATALSHGGAATVDRFKARLTHQRTKQLRLWLEGIPEGDVCAGSVKTPFMLKEGSHKASSQ